PARRRRRGRGPGDEGRRPDLVRPGGAASREFLLRPRAPGGESGLAGAPQTRARRPPAEWVAAATPGTLPRRSSLGRRLDRRSAGVYRPQMRDTAAPAGAHVPPDGTVAERTSVRPTQAGPPGARRLPRSGPGVLEPP